MIVSTKDSVVISMTESEYRVLVNAVRRAHAAATNDQKNCTGNGYSTSYMYDVYAAQAKQYWTTYLALQKVQTDDR